MRMTVLVHDRRSDGPVVVEIDLQRRADTPGLVDVEILLHELGVLEMETVAHTPDGDFLRRILGIGSENRISAQRMLTEDIVDVASVMLVESGTAEGDVGGDRQVEHALQAAAYSAMVNRVEFGVHSPSRDSELRLVGDDADRAGFARGAVKRALRTREALDAGDIVNVDVERSADRRDRLFVKVEADRRQGAGMVAVAAGGHAAHVDSR